MRQYPSESWNDLPRFGFVWSEIVTGDLEKRKQEIIEENKNNFNPNPVIFYNQYQVDDLLDFEI